MMLALTNTWCFRGRWKPAAEGIASGWLHKTNCECGREGAFLYGEVRSALGYLDVHLIAGCKLAVFSGSPATILSSFCGTRSAGAVVCGVKRLSPYVLFPYSGL